MRVNVPVVVTPDQSYVLKAEEKVTTDGLESDEASL
jgi:hypothetical protein